GPTLFWRHCDLVRNGLPWRRRGPVLHVVKSGTELLQPRLQVVDLVTECCRALPLRAVEERGKTDRRLPGRLLATPEPLLELCVTPWSALPTRWAAAATSWSRASRSSASVSPIFSPK